MEPDELVNAMQIVVGQWVIAAHCGHGLADEGVLLVALLGDEGLQFRDVMAGRLGISVLVRHLHLQHVRLLSLSLGTVVFVRGDVDQSAGVAVVVVVHANYLAALHI